MVLDELIAPVEAENRNNSINVYRRQKEKRLLDSLIEDKSRETVAE